MTFSEIRKRSGLSQNEFAKKYNIPARTIQNWDESKSKPPVYVLELLERVVKMDYPEN